MKNKFIFLIAISVVLGCKKYEDDDFISTYTPEKRLWVTSNENVYWSLTIYENTQKNLKFYLPSDLYNLRFWRNGTLELFYATNIYGNDNGVQSAEIYNRSFWSLIDNKSKITMFDQTFKIKQLEVDRLNIESEGGERFFFTKSPASSFRSANNMVNEVPLPYLFSDDLGRYKLIYSNPLDTNPGISAIFTREVYGGFEDVPFEIGPGNIGSALVYDKNLNYSLERAVKIIFNINWINKPGYISFDLRRGGGTFNIKLNDVNVEPEILNCNGCKSDWQKYLIKINEAGPLNVKIETDTVKQWTGCSGIDELRVWELVE